jgi:hypothetical protein
MSKKVSEANPGIKALAKKAPEVVQRMGYTMQMNKPKTNNANNFSEYDQMRMAKSSIYMMGKNSGELEGVVLPGTDKSSENKIDINEFNKQSDEIKKNIGAARSAFSRSITSDSLTNVLEKGKGNIPPLDLKRYRTGREMLSDIPKYLGNSKDALEAYGKHDTAFRKKEGYYSDDYLRKN